MTHGNRAHALLIIAGIVLLMAVMVTAGCGDPPKPKPIPECDDDLDCPDGSNCTGGKCVRKVAAAPRPECLSNEDCSDNKICVDGKCKYECMSDADCGAGMQCKANRCVEADCEIVRVHFDFDEYYLTSEAQSVLRSNVECIKEKGATKITIEGHCDERGSIQYNLSLGQKRATAVRKFMSDMGIERSMIKVISYGEERPLDYGHDEDAWAKNRRGETIIE